MAKMTKYDMARILVQSPAWDGIKDADELCKAYSWYEIKDAYDMLEEAEEEYFNSLYEEE